MINSNASKIPALLLYSSLFLASVSWSEWSVAGILPGSSFQAGLPLLQEAWKTPQSSWLTGAQGQVEDLLPADEHGEKNGKNGNSGEKEKKCMTVCLRWGQECIIDSVRGTRKCRRICKEFGQECF